MTRINQVDRATAQELEPLFQMLEQTMGFLPNSFLTMAHWPEFLQSLAGCAGTVLATGEIEPQLKQLVAFVSSNASGCRYCQAHTSHSAEKSGASPEKIQAAFEFETSELFTDAERAALRLAAHAGMVPNGVTGEHVESMRQHYSDRQIVEIVAVISLFGAFNRWNDTMATTLESSPTQFAGRVLSDSGWEAGKHGS
jgi:AhpD family alkylhydroperoxidase